MSAAQPRVLILPASYFARDRTVGGGERYALEYARALAELTPTTLALFDPTPARETLGRLTLETFPIRHFHQRRLFPLTRTGLRATAPFDLLHAMVFPTPATDLLIAAAKLRGQKIVLTDVGGGGACWSTYLRKLHRTLDLNRRAHGLALLSRHAARFFHDWPQPRTLLYGGVNLAEFAPATEPPRGYALFVGRLLPHKGVLELINALGPDTPLHVVGRPYDDAYAKQLQRAASGKDVLFIFNADDAELRRQYAGANVVLQPSLPSFNPDDDKSELLGLVTLEAMACAKPVIVTQTASLPELVLDSETGYIVPPHHAETLRARVELFLQQPALTQSMGAAARRHIEQNFTWEKVARRGLEFYRSLDPHPAAP